MSRIGKKIIEIPENVTINVSEDNVVTVKGPKGELSEKIHPDFKVTIKGNEIELETEFETIQHKSLHGLSRSLIYNMVVGTTEGYEIKLLLEGVGFRGAVNGQQLDMSLGFSHNVVFELPNEVTATVETVRGKAPIVTLSSIDKQLVGAVAAKIRSLRKPEPYKGKGVLFQGELVRRKAGKTAAK